MNKFTFISRLAKELKDFDPVEKQNILDFYSEMIEDNIDSGLNEEEAVAKLASLEEIVRQVKAEHAQKQQDERRNTTPDANALPQGKSTFFSTFLKICGSLILGMFAFFIICPFFGFSLAVVAALLLALLGGVVFLCAAGVTCVLIALLMFFFFVIFIPKALLVSIAHLGGFLGFLGLAVFAVIALILLIKLITKIVKYCLYVFYLALRRLYKIFKYKFSASDDYKNKHEQFSYTAAAESEYISHNLDIAAADSTATSDDISAFAAETTAKTEPSVLKDNKEYKYLPFKAENSRKTTAKKFVLATLAALLLCFSGLVLGLLPIAVAEGPLNLAAASGYQLPVDKSYSFAAEKIEEISIHSNIRRELIITASDDGDIRFEGRMHDGEISDIASVKDKKLVLSTDYLKHDYKDLWENIQKLNFFNLFAYYYESAYADYKPLYIYLPADWRGEVNLTDMSRVTIKDANLSCNFNSVKNIDTVSLDNVVLNNNLNLKSLNYLRIAQTKIVENLELNNVYLVDMEDSVVNRLKADGRSGINLLNSDIYQADVNLSSGYLQAQLPSAAKDYNLDFQAALANNFITAAELNHCAKYYQNIDGLSVGLIYDGDPELLGKVFVELDNNTYLLAVDGQLQAQYLPYIFQFAFNNGSDLRNMLADAELNLPAAVEVSGIKEDLYEKMNEYLKTALQAAAYSLQRKTTNSAADGGADKTKELIFKVKKGYLKVEFVKDQQHFGANGKAETLNKSRIFTDEVLRALLDKYKVNHNSDKVDVAAASDSDALEDPALESDVEKSENTKDLPSISAVGTENVAAPNFTPTEFTNLPANKV